MNESPKIAWGDLDLSTNMIGYTMTVSREYALDMGMIEPTAEELAERNESGRAFHERQRTNRAEFLVAIDDLKAEGGLTAQLLTLHAPDVEAQWTPECPGCDFSGREGEPPEWPCRTIEALAEHHGINLPSRSLPGAHYEGEFVPSDGKRFEWPAPRWHFAESEE